MDLETSSSLLCFVGIQNEENRVLCYWSCGNSSILYIFSQAKTFVYLCFLYLFLLCWVGEQHDGGFVFDSSTIERMEMLILGALKWRMRSVNPFSFTDYFISFFKFKDKPSVQDLKNRATEIILKSQSGWFSRIEEFRQLLSVNIYTWFNNGVLLLFL